MENLKFLSDEQVNSFNENGYLVLDRAFEPEELKNFQNTFFSILRSLLRRAEKKHSELPKELGQFGDAALSSLYNSEPEYLSIFQRTISRTPEFFRICSSQPILNAIRQLMGVEPDSGVYLLSNGIIMTGPSQNKESWVSNIEKNWHQDTFFTIPGSEYIQLWGPVLQKSTQELGTLLVCPGSHKDGINEQEFHPEKPYNDRYSMTKEAMKKYKHVSLELEVGQVAIFHSRLIHASGVNISPDRFRISILGIYHNAKKESFTPVSTHYLYHDKTPEAWFYEVYGDERAKERSADYLSKKDKLIGGV